MEEDVKNTPTPDESIEVEPESSTDAEIGNIKISVDVVSTIAGIAASQTKGVAEMYSSFAVFPAASVVQLPAIS